MSCFTSVASAPGKTILFGEHAVVYPNHSAVATALSSLRIRTTVEVAKERPDGKGGKINANLRDVKEGGLSCTLECDNVLELGLWADDKAESGLLLLGEGKISQIKELIRGKGGLGGDEDVLPMVPLVALVGGILGKRDWLGKRDVKITVDSKSLPVGSGLGSSAAFCVSLSAALLNVRSGGKGGGEDVEVVPGGEDLETINSWAYYGESIIHGAPSGIDNSVSTFGGCLRMRRIEGEDGEIRMVKDLMKMEATEILITNTFVPKSTKDLVAGVKRRWEEARKVYDPIFLAMSEISEAFLKGGLGLERVNELVRLAQGLLRTIGVTHPAIEMVVEKSRAYGVETKLTGAGGGGCVITLLGGVEEEIKGKVQEALGGLQWEGEIFQVMRTEAGGEGVTWMLK